MGNRNPLLTIYIVQLATLQRVFKLNTNSKINGEEPI